MTMSFKSAGSSTPNPHQYKTPKVIVSCTRLSARAVRHSTRALRALPAPRFWIRHASLPLRPPDLRRSCRTAAPLRTPLISRSTGDEKNAGFRRLGRFPRTLHCLGRATLRRRAQAQLPKFPCNAHPFFSTHSGDVQSLLELSEYIV